MTDSEQREESDTPDRRRETEMMNQHECEIDATRWTGDILLCPVCQDRKPLTRERAKKNNTSINEDNRDLLNEVAQWKDEYNNVCKFATDYEQQRDQLRSENAALKEELSKYHNVPLLQVYADKIEVMKEALEYIVKCYEDGCSHCACHLQQSVREAKEALKKIGETQ